MPLMQFKWKETIGTAALEQQGARTSLAEPQRFAQGKVEGAAKAEAGELLLVPQKDGKVRVQSHRGLLKILRCLVCGQ